MRLEKAFATSQVDQKELKNFFEKFTLNSVVDLKIRRPNSYFAPYEIQSNEFETLVLRDNDGEIHGVASFIYRDVFYVDHVQKIAIATDLRIQPSRKAILKWSEHFLPVLRDVMQKKSVSCVLSVINTLDPLAINAFVRPRQIRRILPRYHLYRKFSMVSLHGRLPWAPKPLSSLKICRGEEKYRGAILEYIERRAPYRTFCSAWDEPSFERKMGRLPGFSLQNFWIAMDSSGKVVGTVAPWSPAQTQNYVPLRYNLRGHNFRQFLKFGSALGWTRSLTKPRHRTGKEIPLKFQFLTFAQADNEDIFESLLWHAYEGVTNDEFLVYAHCKQDFRLNPPLSWISAEFPLALYAIVPPEDSPPHFLHPTQMLNPEIEAPFFF